MLAKNNAECHEEVNEKIKIALKLLNLRDMCYLIQFWSLYGTGKYKFLKTVNQPFGLGIYEEGLCSYRKESERKWLPVDAKVQEHDLIPAVRVFKRGLPEWTSDVTKGYSRNHPLQDCAFRSNLHGYLVLPVFDSFTMSCVGVLESITSSKYFDCAYEVQQIHRALKAANLTSPQAFDSSPMSYVDCNNTRRELDEIFKTLKDVCEAYKLPLAQTWTISSKSSFVATGSNIEMTCSSFNSNCIGKVCMSTTSLPFYVHDLRFWPFREACKEHHLLKSRGVVGRALSSQGSCFCADVTKLDDDEYSLVHNARMNGLASCFAIYLHSIEHGSYVLEFFLPVDMKEVADLQNLVHKVKLHLKLSSFVLGDVSTTDLIGMQTNVSQLSLQMQLNSKESATVGKTNAETHCINAKNQSTFSNNDLKNWNNGISNTEELYVNGVTRNKLDVVTKQRRKHKKDSVTREAIQQNFGKPIGEASKRLGVSRSTLKRVCRKLNITSWPLPHRHKKPAHLSIYVVVLLLVRMKRWSCSSNRHGFSAKWWICGKHNAFDSKFKMSIEAHGSSIISKPSFIPPKDEKILERHHLSQIFNEPASIETPNTNPPQVRFDMFPVSPKKNMATVSADIRMLIVKATYESDMIKFQVPLSSGLLELKNQVARRFKLRNSRLHLKYRDEDDDLILIACDTDLRTLIPFSGYSISKNTVKLIVQTADDD
ncbi:NIN-like protein [Tanacetum coccineum]